MWNLYVWNRLTVCVCVAVRNRESDNPKSIRMPRDGMINQASQLLYGGFTTAWTEGQCSFMRCINKCRGGEVEMNCYFGADTHMQFKPSIISLQLSHGLFLIVLHSRSNVGIRNKTMITVGKKSWNLLYITNEVTSKDHVEKWPLLLQSCEK